MAEPHLLALASAEPNVLWVDQAEVPESQDTLVRKDSADLCVVGGGYTGLWTAIMAKERDPGRDVVLLEGSECGLGASGSNGGFVLASLTHGGLDRFSNELDILEGMGLDNLVEIEAFIAAHNIDCAWERNGVIDVATTKAQVLDLAQRHQKLAEMGQGAELWDRDRVQAEVHSPTYEAGIFEAERAALVDPARLAFGLKRVALELGVRIFEDSKVTGLTDLGGLIEVTTGFGTLRAPRVALGTNAYPPLIRQIKRYVVPVYDYVLATEPLSAEQLHSIGWQGRQGLGDSANQFHYYRLTADNRIVWGGYDAMYYFGGKMSKELQQRPETFITLSRNFFDTFPQLEGLQFTHMWGGAIDTCSRFTVFWGQDMGKKLTYAIGYTGLGVAASRFGARVMNDLIDERASAASSLDFVKKKPIPFPPEPLRFLGIEATKWSMKRADEREGQRNLWLRALDKAGLGFDS